MPPLPKISMALAVRVTFTLGDDYLSSCAEVPFLDIVVACPNDGTALIQANELVMLEMARRYDGTIRQGLQTQGSFAETREVLFAETDGALFDEARYIEEELWRPNGNLYWVLTHVAEQHETTALGDADTVLAGGDLAGSQAVFNERSGDAVADSTITPGEVGFEEIAIWPGVNGHDLKPVLTAKDAPVKDVANLEAIGARRVDHDLAAHHPDTLGGFGAAQSPGDSGAPCQLGFFFVDDLPGVHAKCNEQLGTDGVSPVGKVFEGIDYPSFSRDLVLCHLPSSQNFC